VKSPFCSCADSKPVQTHSHVCFLVCLFICFLVLGGTAIETAAADQANIMWGACHYRSIKYQKCDSPDWPKVQRRIDERMPAGLKYVGEPWHCPTQWQLPYMFENVDTFVVVRNPYERVVSEYYCSSYGYKGPNPDLVETFNHWVFGNVTDVTRALHGHMLPQAYYVYDENGNKIIDHVIRYENLSAEFDALMVEYGLPIKLPSKKEGIPMFHTYNRKGVSHSQQMTVNELSPENIAKINEVYARDFELFGYRIL
jgi:Sulfotransferase family